MTFSRRAFIGASASYSLFAGLSEFAGGVLLLFRRTALLGAMVSSSVLLNVVVLNFRDNSNNESSHREHRGEELPTSAIFSLCDLCALCG